MNEPNDSGPALRPIQVLFLIKHLLTAEEPKFAECKPNLSASDRNQLRDLGLIAYEKRAGFSRTGRKSTATHIVLTDTAWLWAANNLDAPFTARSNGEKALAALLPKLKAYCAVAGVSLAEVLTAAVPAPEDPGQGPAQEDLDGRIRAAYLRASRGEWDARVKLRSLRMDLTDLPRDAVDSALLRLQSAGLAVLYPNNDPWDTDPEDEAAALDISGAKRHLIYMKNRVK